jgi:opine dehydrogenase
MEVTVIGAGHGGLAAAADLGRRGHRVRLQSRNGSAIEAVEEAGGIRFTGAIGDGLAPVVVATTDLATALSGTDVVVVVLPALAHRDVFGELARSVPPGVPVVLDPGHMCGSVHLRRVFGAAGRPPPPIVELGTLSYICRSHAPASVDVTLRTQDVPAATSPEGDPALAALVTSLFPGTRIVRSPVEAWLHDVNLVLHPPGMVLGASRIEAAHGGFGFYADGVTPSVERTMRALDDERVAVGRAFGLELPDLARTMAAFGSADQAAAERGDLGAAVRNGAANRSITAPASVEHRYLHEDVPYGLVPLMALADTVGVPTPVASALTVLAETITGRAYRREGLNAGYLQLDRR